ncbi:MAG: ROK family protein [Hyphomicrobiaceae bacterium]
MKPGRIVADVGGTRSRFGISGGPGDLSDVRVYATAERPTFVSTLAAFVADIAAGPVESWCRSVHIAAAGPVDRGTVQLTNAAWSISAQEVSDSVGGRPVTLVNDLEAVGLVLPHLQPSDLAPVGTVASAELVGSRIAINVGTGFGAASAIRSRKRRWAVAAGEAGHMVLAPSTAEEGAVLGWGGTVEDFLSGAGVARLYAAHARGREGDAGSGQHTAEAVFALAGRDPAAARTAQMFSRLLGRVAGDLVLATAAWDGAFLCGSVAKAWLEVADLTAFRAAFEAKGPMRARMARVPTFVISTPEPALLGLTYGEPLAD